MYMPCTDRSRINLMRRIFVGPANIVIILTLKDFKLHVAIGFMEEKYKAMSACSAT